MAFEMAALCHFGFSRYWKLLHLLGSGLWMANLHYCVKFC